jgi:hypothetical protein
MRDHSVHYNVLIGRKERRAGGNSLVELLASLEVPKYVSRYNVRVKVGTFRSRCGKTADVKGLKQTNNLFDKRA